MDIRLDPYMGLKAASAYCGLSVSTLRHYLHAEPALPYYQPGEKTLIRVSELDCWLRQFRSVGSPDIDRLVDGVMDSLRAQSPNTALGGLDPRTRRNTGHAGGRPAVVAPGLRNLQPTRVKDRRQESRGQQGDKTPIPPSQRGRRY